MKVQYEIAEGHKRGESGLNEYIKSNPGLEQPVAVRDWIEGKFGTWVRDNIGTDYAFESTSPKQFVIDFTYADDAALFVSKLGGHTLEA